jgi:hypothetical protein
MNLRLMAPQRDQQSGSTALGVCWASDRAKSGSSSSAASKFSAASASPASAVSARACNLTEDIDPSAASTASEGADSAEDEGPASASGGALARLFDEALDSLMAWYRHQQRAPARRSDRAPLVAPEYWLGRSQQSWQCSACALADAAAKSDGFDRWLPSWS